MPGRARAARAPIAGRAPDDPSPDDCVFTRPSLSPVAGPAWPARRRSRLVLACGLASAVALELPAQRAPVARAAAVTRTRAEPAASVRAAAPRTPARWLQQRSGTDNAGNVPGTLEVTWRFKAQRPVRGISVAGNAIVLGTESADAASFHFGPDERGFVTVLDVTTGEEHWTREVPNWIHGDPVVSDGRVYVTYGHFPMDNAGGVTAFDLRTGATAWAHATRGGVMPAPALDTATGRLVTYGGDGVLRVFDAATGAVVLERDFHVPNAMSSPRLDAAGEVYAGAESTLVAFNIRRDSLTWRWLPPGLIMLGTPPVALGDSTVYSEGTRRIPAWEAFRRLPFGEFVRLAREGRALYRGRWSSYDSWFHEQRLLAVDRRTGVLRWEAPLGTGLTVFRNNSGTPVLAGGRVVISSPVSHTLRAFDATTGAPLWSRPFPSVHVGALTIRDDMILVGDKAGDLSILRVADGMPIGRCHAGAAFSPTPPVIVGRTVIAATRDGWVFAAPLDSVRARAARGAPTRCF